MRRLRAPFPFRLAANTGYVTNRIRISPRVRSMPPSSRRSCKGHTSLAIFIAQLFKADAFTGLVRMSWLLRGAPFKAITEFLAGRRPDHKHWRRALLMYGIWSTARALSFDGPHGRNSVCFCFGARMPAAGRSNSRTAREFHRERRSRLVSTPRGSRLARRHHCHEAPPRQTCFGTSKPYNALSLCVAQDAIRSCSQWAGREHYGCVGVKAAELDLETKGQLICSQERRGQCR